MVRAANTGISTVVDAAGRISVRLGIGETGAIDTRLPVSVPSTFYGKTGDLLFILIAMVLLAISVFLRFSVSRSKSWG
jgi:apolipoprotein N-acyltransferase